MGIELTPFRASQARRQAWLPAAFVASYVAIALIAYKWTVVPGGLAIFWPNNGLVAAALLLLPVRRGLAVAAASLATDVLCAHHLGGSPWGQAGLIGGFDIAEAWSAAVLIRNCGGAALDLTRVRRFGAMILLGVLPATLCVGTAGSLLFKAVYGADLPTLWASWAIGDFMGMSIGAPAALIIARFGRFDRPQLSSPWLSMGLVGALTLVAAIPFYSSGPPLTFIIFPLFLIAAFRLTPPYAAAAAVFVAVIAAAMTIAGHGPFAAMHVANGAKILRLQFYLACLVFSLFLVQGALAERARTHARVQNALSKITRARARTETALERLDATETRFRLLADNAVDVIARCDAEGRFLYISPSAREVFGYEPDELLGQTVNVLIFPEDLPLVEAQRSCLLSGEPGARARMEYRIVKKTGDVRWIEVSPFAVRSPETGEIIELHAISRDITRRKGLEAELEARRAEAEAASIAKTEFLANMSHEIRTPLNGVIAMADLLARSELNEHDRKLVEIIRSSGDSLNRLLSDILDLARIEAGRVELECAPFHFGEAVRSAVALCALHAQEKGLLLEVEVASEADQCFEGDEVRIRQIVTNLVSNAVKFTSQGEVRVRAAAPPSGGVAIEVADTGVGFDPALGERLFERFQQADGSITRRFGGTGLGLPISRQLALTMGGSLQCDSTPGEGSRFWFEAPLRRANPGAPAEAQDEPAQTSQGGKVLVVDDHPTNRTVAELILTDFGFDVQTAENGAEAIAAIEKHRFDLILMDMQMPVVDGLTAVRRIRALEGERAFPRAPILMLSANALPQHHAQSEEAGADGHVAKPITAAALLNAIAAVAGPEAAPGGRRAAAS